MGGRPATGERTNSSGSPNLPDSALDSEEDANSLCSPRSQLATTTPVIRRPSSNRQLRPYSLAGPRRPKPIQRVQPKPPPAGKADNRSDEEIKAYGQRLSFDGAGDARGMSCRAVTTEIEEAWKLPEDERKKFIRRLLLQWHPDKNKGGD